MTEDPTLFWYLVSSTTIIAYLGYKWTRKGFINANTKVTFIALASWGIYEIVRTVM
jgi:hypothetical protein